MSHPSNPSHRNFVERRAKPSSLEYLDQFAGFAMPRLLRLVSIVIVGMSVIMFADSSILALLLIAEMVGEHIITVNLLPILIVLVAVNLLGVLSFIGVLLSQMLIAPKTRKE